MTGRPTILTPALAEEICGYVRAGNYVETAAEASGVAKSTVYKWLEDAKSPDASAELVAFSDAYNRAAAEAEHDGLAVIKAGDDGWQSNAWFLERRFRARWRRDIPDESAAAPPAPPVIQIQLPATDSERVSRLEAALRAAGIEVPR